MQFFNVLEKNAAAAAMIFFKTCRNRAAMEVSASEQVMHFFFDNFRMIFLCNNQMQNRQGFSENLC
jgi:hypothetical protein